MKGVRWAVLAALVLSLLAAPAAIAEPIITEPASEQQPRYPIIVSQDNPPNTVGQMFTGCQVDEETGQRDTLVTYKIKTTGTVTILSSAVGPGYVYTRHGAGTKGGVVLHVLVCERTATA
jgi:hypothetical protein